MRRRHARPLPLLRMSGAAGRDPETRFPSADAGPSPSSRGRLRRGLVVVRDTQGVFFLLWSPSVAERPPMVILEPVTRRASPALRVHEAASAPVPLVHRTPHRRRDVARRGRAASRRRRACARGRRGFRFLRTASGREEPFLGAFVLAKRRASSRSSFSVTACSMTAARSPSGTEWRMSAQPLELVVELGAGGELHLVASRGEGLDRGGPGGRRMASAARRSTRLCLDGVPGAVGAPRLVR